MYTIGQSIPAAMLLYCRILSSKDNSNQIQAGLAKQTDQPVVIAHSTMPMPEPSKYLYHTGTGRRALYNKVRFSAQVRL